MNKVTALELMLLVSILLGGGPVKAQSGFDCADVTEIPLQECEALVAFYYDLDGPGWSGHDDWLTTNTPCQWDGIECTDGYVTTLDLYDQGLYGYLPPEMLWLTHLKILDIGYSSIYDPLPNWIGGMASLEQLSLSLSFYALGGEDPTLPKSIGNLENLEILEIDNNAFEGPIPMSWTRLRNLWLFAYDYNNVCTPTRPRFRHWLRSIDFVYSNGEVCP